ncbi:MAG: hypothetical protein ACRDIB_07235, partial [Ardenticatenaceae bacterium]
MRPEDSRLYYPLPQEYLFEKDEAFLDLWDRLFYEADWESGAALFRRVEITGGLGFVRNRHRFRRWLQQCGRRVPELLTYEDGEQAFIYEHNYYRRSAWKEPPEQDETTTPADAIEDSPPGPEGVELTPAQEDEQLLQEIRRLSPEYYIRVARARWHDVRRHGLPKPRGYHSNRWMHELRRVEHRWLVNLLFHLKLAHFTQAQLNRELTRLRNDKELAHLKRVQKQLPALLSTLHPLRLVVPAPQQSYIFERERFADNPVPWPQHDYHAARQQIAAVIQERLDRSVSAEEDAVELVRHFHRYGGVGFYELHDLYRYLASQRHWDWEPIKRKVVELTDVRDRSIYYRDFFNNPDNLTPRPDAPSHQRLYRDYAQNPTSLRVRLRLDDNPIVGAPLRFDPPLKVRPGALNLHCEPRWKGSAPRQRESLSLSLLLDTATVLPLDKKLSSVHDGAPDIITLMDKLPVRFKLDHPLTLLIMSPRPLPDLTVVAWLVAH